MAWPVKAKKNFARISFRRFSARERSCDRREALGRREATLAKARDDCE
jgi:hypothetical protein